MTPTGAALVATLADEFGPLPELTLERTGYGAGTRDMRRAAERRARDRRRRPRRAPTRTVSLIETNLDDLLPELAPDAAAACFAAGALDVWTTPAQMKRGRPGFVLSALARPGGRDARGRPRCCARRARSACASRDSTGSSSSARAARWRSAASRCA